MTDPAVSPPSIYVDANPFIYFIEGDEEVASSLRPFFDALKRKPGLATTSELTLAEVLPKAKPAARRSYLSLIVWSRLFDLQPVTRTILIDTADYRRATMRNTPDGRSVMTRLPDAIHMVTAIQGRCRAILSADSGLKTPKGMTIFRPNQAGIEALLRDIA
jgi:predicted nucleic acid-binding protein